MFDRPVKLLKGFKRVNVSAGAKAEAEIEIPFDEIKFYCPETKEWILDEKYTVSLGTDSRNVWPVGELVF